MKITIEEYRGFEIYFDTNYEVFQCVVSDESAKESKSFSAVKSFIDEYKKNNQDFRPFWVVGNPDNQHEFKEKTKIIGIRKDGRLISEVNGVKSQVSDYDLSHYILDVKDNERFFVMLDELKAKMERQRLENTETRNKILAGMKLTTLKDYKKTLTQ